MPKRVVRHAVEQPLDQAYRLIALTKGQTAIVDICDFARLSIHLWWAKWNEDSQTFYAARSVWENRRKRAVMMHAEVLGAGAGRPDHIDGNGLNNRRSNLRRASYSQNAANSRTRSTNTSGFKGVSWYPRDKKWRAQITVNRKARNLGLYSSPEEAHRVYLAAAKESFGAFARG